MARKPNYDFERRKKEQERKAKKEAKREQRQQRRDERRDEGEEGGVPPDADEAPAQPAEDPTAL